MKPRTRKPETVLRHFMATSKYFASAERSLTQGFIAELRRSLRDTRGAK